MGSSDRLARPGSGAARHAVAVLLTTVAAAGAGGAAATWSAGRHDVHRATAVVMLHPLAGNAYSPGGRGDELVNLETEAEVLRSDAVARAVLAELGQSGDADDLLRAITVSVPPNTQLLHISARAPDGVSAVERASTFATVYLAFRRARTQSALAERTSRLQESVATRSAERKRAIRQLARLEAGSAERPIKQHQIDELTVQISSLRAQLVTAEAEPLDAGQVVSAGRLDDPGILADPAATGGLAGGAVLLAALALLVARTERRRLSTIRSLDDLIDLAPPPLGSAAVPVQPDGAVVAAARSAVLTVATSRPRVVVIARADHGEQHLHGPLTTALANARHQVVSVDLSRPDHVAALTELVLDDAAVDDVLTEAGPFLSTLQPQGEVTGTQAIALPDLASSAGMTRALHELAKRADFVLVTCTGLDTATGRAILSAAAGAVIEVVRGTTTREDVDAAAAEAENVGCQPLGVALLTCPHRGRHSEQAADGIG